MNAIAKEYGGKLGEVMAAAAAVVDAEGGAVRKVPERKFRAGSVTATVWKGVSQTGSAYYNVQISKSYKDKDNNWKNTSSFRENDVPKAMVVLQKAYEFVILQGQGLAENI